MTIHLNTQADLDRAIHALVEQDPRLKPVLKRAGMPALRRRDPGYAGLAAIVCGQQLSTASAAAIWARVSAAFDPFHHDALRRARAERLGRLGLSAAKIKTLKNLARELAAERLNLEVLANEEADAAHNTLTALHGIGPWTADVYLLFCLGHGDAWPAGDLAVQEAVKIGLGLTTRPTAKEMAPLAEPWRPMRGAAAYLWWTYYRALKKREGVIGAPANANAVSGTISVAAPSAAKTKTRAEKTPGSEPRN
jgi:DNA-3-methyladenine glycosylase II